MVTKGYLSTLWRIRYRITMSQNNRFIVTNRGPLAIDCVEHLRTCHSSASGEWVVHVPQEWYTYHGFFGSASGFIRTMGANRHGLMLQ